MPSGANLCSDAPPNKTDHSPLYTTEGIGPSYLKAQYVEYTDATFAVRFVVDCQAVCHTHAVISKAIH